MPRAKAKGKKDAVFDAPKDDVAPRDAVEVVKKSTSDELFDALLKEQDAGIANNENISKDEEPAKAANGRGGGRGKKTEKVEKEMPAKKAAASRKGGGKKAAGDVEVIAEVETENIESNGVVEDTEELKEEEVENTKGKGGRGKRGATKAAPVVVEENGGGEQKENGVSDETEKQEVATAPAKAKGRGGKRATKTNNKDAIEASVEDSGIPEETATAVTKGKSGKKTTKGNKDANVETPIKEETPEELVTATKGRGGKRTAKTNSKDASEAAKEDVVLNKDATEASTEDSGIPEETATATKGRGGKRSAKTNSKDASEVAKEDDVFEELSAAKTKNAKAATKSGRKKKAEEKEAPTASTEKEIDNTAENENAEKEPPKKKGRGGNTKKTAAVVKVEESTVKTEEVEVVAKKPTKRGAKEAAKDKAEPEKIPAKRARGAGKTSNKTEEVSIETPKEIEQPTEEVVVATTNKRSRKEPSVEKELKTETEKPKKAPRGGKRKADKVEEEAVVDPKQVKEDEEEAVPVEAIEETKKVEKPTTSRGGRKRAAPSTNKTKITAADEEKEKVDDDKKVVDDEAKVADDDEDDEADGSKPSKAKKKKEPSAAPINATTTNYNKADFDLPPLAEGQTGGDAPRFNLKISSWNVAGLRAWLKKEGLKFLDYEEPDIFCLQETKCVTDQLPEEVQRIPGYHPYWLCMPGGYAGVAIYSKIMPINVEYGIGNKEFDDVGRIITAEYEKFFLVNVYVPNSGRKLVNLEARMKWEKLFQEFVQRLNDRKPVVVCGDMNVSHQEIDLANPKANTRNAGFTKEERDKMSELLALGYVDTFRHLYPERKAAYTFWTYMGNARSRNIGWRLDYFIVSERFIKRVVDNCIRSQCMGSDHCPITLFLKL